VEYLEENSMDLETHVKPELWAAIAHSYETSNYTHAVRDAMALITEILRDKSGLDGDGDPLVGAALGFSQNKPPRIKINKLQTQTEQDMQRGLMLILKGMYALVRNPRTHERLSDDRKTADTIILFVDYLLDFLGASYQSFTVQDFLNLVTDPHFVPDAEYVSGLVDKVPARKRSDTLIELYRQVNWKQADSFELVMKELINRLVEEEIQDFLSVVSDDLQRADQISSVTLVIKILPGHLWPQIERMPRLRVENMLLDQLETAWYVPQGDRTNNPAATWINRIAGHYLRKPKLRKTIISKLKARDFDQHNFVARYILRLGALPSVFEDGQRVKECVAAITESVRAGNEYMKDSVKHWMSTTSPHEWDEKFVESLKDLTDPDNPELYLPDGTPFLGRFIAQSNPVQEEELPF
jgi:uncharacterized protein (TIGR02391 family)